MSNFNALGLKFSKKESVVGFVKSYGKWTKPLKFLGITYDPKSNLVSGPQGVRIGRDKLLRILRERGFKEYARIITGMCPGEHSCAPVPTEGIEDKAVMPNSVLAKYCEDYRLGGSHYGHILGRFYIFYLPLVFTI